MGSPISSIMAKLYMEEFEIRAINTAKHPPRILKRYICHSVNNKVLCAAVSKVPCGPDLEASNKQGEYAQ